MEGLRETTPEEIRQQVEDALSSLKNEIFNARELIEEEKLKSGNPYITCVRNRLSLIRDYAFFIKKYSENIESTTKIIEKTGELLNELERAEDDMPEISESLLEYFLSEIESFKQYVL